MASLQRGKKPTGKLIKAVKLVCVNLATNANKYIICEIYDSGDFFRVWGRIRSTPQGNLVMHDDASGTEFGAGRLRFEDFIDDKMKPSRGPGKVYTEVEVDGPVSSSDNASLSDAVRHVLESTALSYDSKTRKFSTPFGVITPESLVLARQELDILAECVANSDWKSRRFNDAFEEYLRIIPHDLGNKIDPSALLPELKAIRNQNDILDSLDASVAVETVDAILEDATKDIVNDFISSGESWTALDITLILQKQGLTVDTNEIRVILHKMFNAANIPAHYKRDVVARGIGDSKFYVYHPSWMDANEYTIREVD